MWKALIAGESTNLRTPYHNYFFEKSLPTIICTNSYIMLELFREDHDFRTQVVIVDVAKYMGPVGTQPGFLVDFQEYLSDKTAERLQKRREIKKKKEEEKKKKVNAFELLGRKRQNS